ncbi:hypothetical protein [Ferruginibacter sp.]|nr:hypothetical protein [Ferruginibacter sp.]
MKVINTKILSSFALVVIISSCSNSSMNSIRYPFPQPVSMPLPFMPGIVSSSGLDFNSAFSPDGKSFYFGRSENGKWIMYVTTFDGENWTKPVHPSFNDTAYSEADPAFAPDGTLYYISTKSRNSADTIKDYDIWFVKPLAGNQWTVPENMSVVNSDSNELYISFAANDNLYFSSSRQGGFGQDDIYVCKYAGGKYSAPQNLGVAINSPGSDHDPLISKDEDFLVFSSVDRKDGYGQADLYFSRKNQQNRWLPSVNLGEKFNTPTYEYCSYLSRDNQYFFYSTNSDVKWIKAKYLFEEMKKKTKSKKKQQ